MKKGLTYIELLLVMGLIPVIIGIVTSVFKVQSYFAKTRDLQRLQDLTLLNNTLNFYFQNATNLDPDGPNLQNRGVDENQPTIFVSVPAEKDKFFETCFYYPTNKTYYIYQTNKNDYQRIDGFGWIPINFQEVSYPGLSVLPVDPINTLNSGLYYLYSFQRNPPQYEISGGLESPEYQKGGTADKVSTDGGNDENRLEMGTNLNIVPGFIWSF